MNLSTRRLACSLILIFGLVQMPSLVAQDQPAPQTPPVDRGTPTPDAPAPAEEDLSDLDVELENPRSGRQRSRRDNDVVSVGHDSVLAAGEQADSVVSVFGSSTSAGEVFDSVVSVMGNSRATGPVGDSVVAVLGDVYVNSLVRGDVVAVLGTVELGPQADVGGDIVSVGGGGIKRDPAAVLRGGIHDVFAGLTWLKPWIEHCFFYARPLALEPGVGWAWSLALGFLALYVLMALMFRGAMDKCVRTFDEQPGQSALAAVLAMFLTPVLIVVLCITIIGVALVPFVAIAMFVAALFGKAVVLAWIGGRCIRFFGHTAIAVVVGGVIVLALYLVPVVGFLVYNVTGILGFGIVIYTLILSAKVSRREKMALAVAQPSVATVMDSSAPLDANASAQNTTATGTSAAAVVAKDTLPRAGFWIRMAALFIDAVLLGVVLASLSDSQGLFLPMLAIYGAVMWKLRGTTVGGIVCNLQVVRLDGRELDWATAGVRALSCFLSLVLAGLGFIWIVFDEEKQAWHDKIAGTVVVQVPRGMSLV